MFEIIRKIFIGLLTGLVNGSNHTKCVSASEQNCKIQLVLINLHLMYPLKNYATIHIQLN